jgi:acyl-CoA synthetase (AMP-forming)/AMP-acid ligase II
VIPFLHDVLARSAAERATHPAVEEPDGSRVDYAELAALAHRVRDRLQALGVRPGDRVGIWCRKSIDTVAAIFGTLECGAAYVPVDPTAPATRNGYIMANCDVRAVVVEARYASGLRAEMAAAGRAPQYVEIPEAGGGRGLRAALDALDQAGVAAPGTTVRSAPDDLAYILYTSGSTGNPKGVMLTPPQRYELRGVVCSEALAPRPEDRFSAHAPPTVDLSDPRPLRIDPPRRHPDRHPRRARQGSLSTSRIHRHESASRSGTRRLRS